LLLLFEDFLPLFELLVLAVESVFPLGQSHFDFVQLGTGFIGLGREFLSFLDGFSRGVNLGGFDDVFRFSFGPVNLSFHVLREGLGLRFGNHLVDNGNQGHPQKKGKYGQGDGWQADFREYNSHTSYLSLPVLIESSQHRSMEQIAGLPVGKPKEVAMNYEIPFARVQNQLSDAKIATKGGNFSIKGLILFSQLADLLSNSNTPSRVSECFFKQISFHAKFTSVAGLKGRNQISSSWPATGARSVFAA
jgi:hypothetical protein